MVDAFLESGALVHVADLPGHGDDLPDGVGSTACDVSLPEDVDRLFDDAVTFLGSVDVLCNNVGIAGPTGPVEEVDVEAWDKTMAVNVRSTFLCCRRVAPLMREAGGGVILNTSSTAGVVGFPLRSPYAASKWAVVGLGATLAMELGEFGIRVNTIAPGLIDTPIYGEGEQSDAFKAHLGQSVLFPKRLGSGEELAFMVMDLLTNPYMNAEVIRVDGGIRMPPK